jgi:hypothetical protein
MARHPPKSPRLALHAFHNQINKREAMVQSFHRRTVHDILLDDTFEGNRRFYICGASPSKVHGVCSVGDLGCLLSAWLDFVVKQE